MTGFHNTDYGTQTNQSHYQPVSQANHAGSTAKVSQSSFSQKVTANLKMGYLYGNVDLVTGQELYMNYDKSSSEEDPVILAEGIDIHGNAFRRRIHLNDIDVRNASVMEMTALNVHLGKLGDEVIKSHYSFPLESLSSQHDLNTKMNFEQYFQKTSGTLRTAGYRQQAELYKSELERYLFFQTTGRLRKKPEKEHVLFEKEENKTGVFSNKTLAEVAGVNLEEIFQQLQRDTTKTNVTHGNEKA